MDINSQTMVLKMVSYIEVEGGYQTYLHTPDGSIITYSLLPSKEALQLAQQSCKDAGWRFTNATSVVKTFRKQTR
jgi:hypothetical protein